jgi:hypothetical protein
MSEPHTNSIVPFGKYKDHPVDVLLADSGYLEWIIGQPGLMRMLESRYPVIFNLITVGAPATDDTPEHNALQARFLEREFQLAFIETALGKTLDQIAQEARAKAHRTNLEKLTEVQRVYRARREVIIERLKRYQAEGWKDLGQDLRGELAHIDKQLASLPPIPANASIQPKIKVTFECGYDVDFAAEWDCEFLYFYQPSEYEQRCEQKEPRWECQEAPGWFEPKRQLTGCYCCDRGIHRRIELRPVMGDNFPTVLRQMKRTQADTLIVASFAAAGANLEQVRAMFGNIEVLLLSEIEEHINYSGLPREGGDHAC